MTCARDAFGGFTCTRCELSSFRTQIVLPDGPCGRLLVVGEAPGRDEDEFGYGFAGAAGRILDRSLAEHGIRRDDYARTNIVWCRPPNNRAPKLSEIAACSGNFERALATIKPLAILAVGRLASVHFVPQLEQGGSFLSNLQAMQREYDAHGSTALLRVSGVPVVPSPHTSPLAWNRKAPDKTPIREIGRTSIRIAADIIRGI